jgi:hypothetical protein
MSKPDVHHARALGGAAFARGIVCIPGRDPQLTSFMGRREIGDKRTAPELRAWISGWTAASLSSREGVS